MSTSQTLKFIKSIRRVKLQVVANKVSSKTYYKPLVQLPKEVLSFFAKGDVFNVFISNDAIILSPHEDLSFIQPQNKNTQLNETAIELFNTLVRLFIKAFNNPTLHELLSALPETQKAIKLLEKLRGGE